MSAQIRVPSFEAVEYDNFWRITFVEARPDLADQDLMFVWGYQAQAPKDTPGTGETTT